MNRKRLIGESIYCIYIRNHSESGDFQGVIKDLKRIKKLGVTTIWLLPHYPIGEKNRKGELGSPYSIRDYYGVNPELGGLNNFKDLIDSCHKLKLKIIIDVVFNHTSCDSVLLDEHPEWFIRNEDGDFTCKVPQWSDVYDLDFNKKELWSYLIDVLKYWADLGVNGFRCDVASVVPLSFWKMAKDTLNEHYPELIWLGESVEKNFISFIRHKGYICHSDSELYEVFDILFDYDVHYTLEGYILGKNDFETFIRERRNQEVVYPADYLKLRFLENHDSKERAASLIESDYSLKNWKAFSVFEKGIPLIFAGEEIKTEVKTDLFNKEPIDWDDDDKVYYKFLKKLLEIDHLDIVTNGIYTINRLNGSCVHIRYRHKGETLHGIFNFGSHNLVIKVEVLQGPFKNLITGEDFKIEDELLDLSEAPYIFKSIP